MIEQFTTVDERHDEIELVRGLERKFEGNDERVVHKREHGTFRQNVGNFAWT